ncbi:serine/threonine-protein kinase [Paractinoplanes maris]|uniref:serine/threonine-protein kinase n=1 Tax=Paractinoplanes maris TaxID=1734446 RepID=UPI0020213901|nr:serine/threonine-protein kinase [Actinoplanes maris]
MEVRQALGGRYTLLSELGRGGMAVVWRARDEVLGRPVAVKVLARGFAGDPQSRARIRDEARSAATLSHPNIAQVYDYGEADEEGNPLPYVVMELVNGPTLQQRVSSSPLPPRTIFRICGEVAAALAAAHEDGLVHRDIKMANIMVTPAGVKVVDFGIAAAAGPAAPEDRLVGTPAYLAPERLTGDAVVAASDVYALGVLLYRLLAHESPWSVESTTQMLEAHVYVDPAPLPELPGVPGPVADLINRCLVKDPAARPTASEVSATLGDAAEAAEADAVRDDEPTGTRVPRPAPPVEAPRYLAQPTVVARPNDRPIVAGAPAPRGNLGESSRFDRPPNSVWPATALDRPAHSSRRRPEEASGSPGVRKKYLVAGGAVAAVAVAALVTWFLLPDPETEERQRIADAPASVAPTVTSAPARPSAGAPVREVPGVGAVTRAPAPGVIVGSGPAPTIAPSAAHSVPPSVSEPVEPSTSSEPPASPSVAPPAGRRLESPGGVAFATCDRGRVSLTGTEPADGFTAETLEPGPAITARVLFLGARSKYRMAVTCVGQTPTPVVLPL